MGVNHTKHLSPSITTSSALVIRATAGELPSVAPKKLQTLSGIALTSVPVPTVFPGPLQVVKYGHYRVSISHSLHHLGPTSSSDARPMHTGRLTHVLPPTLRLSYSTALKNPVSIIGYWAPFFSSFRTLAEERQRNRSPLARSPCIDP